MTTELEQTIAQRRGRYGPLIESGEVAMKLEDYLRSLPGWERLAYDQREALAMVMHKISRIMCGDPDYDDSWIDIAGYVQNVVNRLREAQKVATLMESFKEPEQAAIAQEKQPLKTTHIDVSLLRAEVKDR